MSSVEIAGSLEFSTVASWSELQAEFGGTGYRIESGELNHALVVDEAHATDQPYVVKFPKLETCDYRKALWQEAALMATLNIAAALPLEVPQLKAIGFHDFVACADEVVPWIPESHIDHLQEASFIVMSYVGGETLGQSFIQQEFSSLEKQELGAKLSEFIFEFGHAIDLQSYAEICRGGTQLFYDRFDLKKILRDIERHGTPQEYGELGEVIEFFDYLSRVGFHWNDWREAVNARDLVIHNDLRPENLRWVKKAGRWALSGVIDFNLVGPGSLSRDLRHVYACGAEIAEHAIQRYFELSGGDYDLVRILDETCNWSLMQAAVNCYYRLKFGAPMGSMPSRLAELGEHWLDDYLARPGPC